MEVTANNQFHNPDVAGLIIQIRATDEQQQMDEVLEALAAGEPRETTLPMVVAVAMLPTIHSPATLLIRRPDGGWDQAAAAGPQAALPTDQAELPWDTAARTGRWVVVEHVHELPEPLARAAQDAAAAACWALPIPQPDPEAVPAVLVLWPGFAGGPEPTVRETIERLAQLAGLVLDRHAHAAALAHAARHDPLTGLANRAHFTDHLRTALAGDAPTGVLYLDLDDFKPVNDAYGHGLGDRVLVATAQRMAAAVRPGDLVARLGGDEFAVVCPGASVARPGRKGSWLQHPLTP